MFSSLWFTTRKVCLAIFTMGKKIEQQVCLKFCVSNGITATESLKMLQKCFGESTLSRTQVFEWHKAFSEGREVVESLPHLSRLSTPVNDDNIEKVKKIVLENRRVGIREVAESLKISYESTQNIVVYVLGKKRVADRFVQPTWARAESRSPEEPRGDEMSLILHDLSRRVTEIVVGFVSAVLLLHLLVIKGSVGRPTIRIECPVRSCGCFSK